MLHNLKDFLKFTFQVTQFTCDFRKKKKLISQSSFLFLFFKHPFLFFMYNIFSSFSAHILKIWSIVLIPDCPVSLYLFICTVSFMANIFLKCLVMLGSLRGRCWNDSWNLYGPKWGWLMSEPHCRQSQVGGWARLLICIWRAEERKIAFPMTTSLSLYPF